MSFVCIICSKPYTDPDTKHALYSTSCGHMIGKSCLDKWKLIRPGKNLNCPLCCKRLGAHGYHPLYGIPTEFFKITLPSSSSQVISDNENKKQYILSNLNQEHQFLYRRKEKIIKEQIDLVDTHNGYVVTVGFNTWDVKNKQILRFIDGSDGKRCYKTELQGNICTALAINKYRFDIIEILLGFDDGKYQHKIWTLDFFDDVTTNEFVIQSKIESICFIGVENFAISAGENRVYVYNITGLAYSKNWCKLPGTERGIVTNLQKLSPTALLGIVNGKIYVFEKNKPSYELCFDIKQRIVSYTVDSYTKMLLIFYCCQYTEGRVGKVSQSYVLYRIIKTPLYNENHTKIIRKIYKTFTVKNISNNHGMFPVPLTSTFFVMREFEKYIVYTFVPNIRTRKVEGILINTETTFLTNEIFNNLDECIGVFYLKGPEYFSPEVLKLSITLAFRKEFVVLDFFVPINDDRL